MISGLYRLHCTFVFNKDNSIRSIDSIYVYCILYTILDECKMNWKCWTKTERTKIFSLENVLRINICATVAPKSSNPCPIQIHKLYPASKNPIHPMLSHIALMKIIRFANRFIWMKSSFGLWIWRNIYGCFSVMNPNIMNAIHPRLWCK